MNNNKVLEKAEEKKEYLNSLYTKDNTSWNRVLDESIEDIDYTIEEFSSREIRQKCCESEIEKIEKIDLEYLVLTQLRKEIIWSELCDSSCCGNITLDGHNLTFTTSKINVRFAHSICGYEYKEIYMIPLSEYFILDEKYWDNKVEYDNNHPVDVNAKEIIQAHVYIRVSKSDRIDMKKLGQAGYSMQFGTITKTIDDIEKESIDIDYLFGLGVSLIDVSFDSCLKMENNIEVSFKNTRLNNKIVKINKSAYASEEFMNIIKQYLEI